MYVGTYIYVHMQQSKVIWGLMGYVPHNLLILSCRCIILRNDNFPAAYVSINWTLGAQINVEEVSIYHLSGIIPNTYRPFKESS